MRARCRWSWFSIAGLRSSVVSVDLSLTFAMRSAIGPAAERSNSRRASAASPGNPDIITLMDDSARIISAELSADETLLWSGAPRQGLMLVPGDLFMIPFSLMWGGFAVFWEAMVFRSKAPVFFRLWGVPFVCVGLYMIAGRFFYDAWKRGRTRYGVTDTRVLIVCDGLQKSVVSLDRRNLGETSLQEKSDGSGTIVFGPSFAWGAFGQTGGRALPPSFVGIPDAKRVYALIRAAPPAR